MTKRKPASKAGSATRRKTVGPRRPTKSRIRSSRVSKGAARIKPFPIVGVGASAGGLEALENFFSHMPADCGIGFVVVTHLHPGHTSLLPELLGKCTPMPVRTAANGVAVTPDTVYMSPPDGCLAILDGTLHVNKPDDSGPLRLPIDSFFRSLADDQKEKAIGIVLSGTGTDGTLGLKAIKGAAGMTMAQAPESAKYSGMPSSAIATGLVDYVLPVEQLPLRLTVYTQGPYLASTEKELPGDVGLTEPMHQIIALLRTRAGHDFSLYKANTIRRRIERRINVHQLGNPKRYLRFLQANPHELDLLFKELLIGVTSFFRDPDAYGALAKTVLPKLLATRTEDAPVRVWVPGCSTGEEAYSLATVLQEGMDQLKKHFPVQIFGTDLDHEAIDAARLGLYPDGIARDVHRPRLSRYFVKEDGGYRIKKEIREMVIFAPQNVLKDPPFTKLDLIACRNLLIYLKPAAQERLLSLFHYALNPGGVLVLGPSESLTGLGDHFAVVNKKWKIFTRKNVGSGYVLPADLSPPASAPPARPVNLADIGARTHKQLLSTMIEKTLLARYAPASVIVNDRGDILYIHGRTGDYLEPATGQPRLNILEMAREGLRIELPSALRRAATHKGPVVHDGARVKTNGDFASVRLTVMKLTEPESVRGLLLVTFETEPAGKPPAPVRRASRTSDKRPPGRVPELERELQYTKETLQSTLEELETSNEELKSTNEELQSTNEELQSANEELETSKEEMQSLNEELQTVNAQLQAKVDDLGQANDDMQNLLNSTAIATIFLDTQLRIKRYTAEATKLVKLIPSDVGRPIGDLASNLRYEDLQADAAEVLRKLGFKEKEVQTTDGEWRQVRISPYRTTENVIEGLVATFVDITRLKEAQQALLDANAYAKGIVATVREPLLLLDEDLRVTLANQAFYREFGVTPKQVEHRHIYELGNRQFDIPRLRTLLEKILPKNFTFENFEVAHEFSSLGHRVLLLNARRLKRETGAPAMILLAMEDVTATRLSARKPAGRTATARPK